MLVSNANVRPKIPIEDLGYRPTTTEAKEYRFIEDPDGKPKYHLNEVIDLCLAKKYNDDDEDEVLFWTSSSDKKACFSRRSTSFSSNKYLTKQGYHCISLVLQTLCKRYPFEIYGRTSTDAFDCLIWILSLPDDDDRMAIDRVTIVPKGTSSYKFNTIRCPICPRSLEILLNSGGCNKRQYKFQRTIFDSNQAYTMATSGTNTNLSFRLCQFEDNGKSFVCGLDDSNRQENHRQSGVIGPAKISFDGYPRQPPFLKMHWLRFFRLANIELCLRYVWFDRECSQALANSNPKGLSLVDCTFADEGEALVESICVNKNGPKSLELEADTFQSMSVWKQFMIEVGHPNCHLQRLSISNTGSGSIPLERVAADGDILFATRFNEYLSKALETNQELKELLCYIGPNDRVSFDRLCSAIETHPSLTKIDLRPDASESRRELFLLDDDNNNASQQRKEYTQRIVQLIERNSMLEEIQFHEEIYDEDIWETKVGPRLTMNRYKKIFYDYQSYRLIGPTFATTLGNINEDPSLIWMLLSNHPDKLVFKISR